MLLWMANALENIEELIKAAVKEKTFIKVENVVEYFDKYVQSYNDSKEDFGEDHYVYKHDKDANAVHPCSLG